MEYGPHIMTQIPAAVTERRQEIERQIADRREKHEKLEYEIALLQAVLEGIDLVIETLAEDAPNAGPDADAKRRRRDLRSLTLQVLACQTRPHSASLLAEAIGGCRESQIESALSWLEQEGKAESVDGGWRLRQEPGAEAAN